MKKIFIYPFLAVLALAVLVPPVSAAQFNANPNYVLEQSQTVGENLYTAGGTQTIDGDVEGDLFVVGGTVSVSGGVMNDLTAVGGNVNITGNVGDDIRTAGGTVSVSGSAVGELLAAAGHLYVAPTADIGGDLTAAAGTAVIDGLVSGKTRIVGSEVVINGRLSGDASITAYKSLTIGGNAVIDGNLSYKSPNPASVADGAQLAFQPVYTKIEVPRNPALWGRAAGAAFGFISMIWLFHLAGMVIAALLVCCLFRKGTEKIINGAIGSFGGQLLRGFLWLVALPVAAVIAFVTLIGIAPALIALVIYAAVLAIAGVFASLVLGALTFRLFSRNKENRVDWKTALVGAVLFQLVRLVPVVGWLFAFVVFLAAFGTLADALYRAALGGPVKRTRNRK